MDATALKAAVGQKGVSAEKIAAGLERDRSLIPLVIAGAESKNAREKFLCLKVLNLLSRKSPEVLYPSFGVFAGMLRHPNRIYQWNALDILANLVRVDGESKFASIKADFFAKFREGNLITAAHVVDNAGLIVSARPAWEGEITRTLIEVDEIDLPTEECRNILGGKIIQAFDRYFEHSANKEGMLEFAARQSESGRPATRAKARDFLKKHSGE
jgi:hypothetical protein